MRTLVVAAVIVDDLDAPSRVLATRRSRPATLAGRWEFPGGKVEPGEPPPAALVREISEEIGVTVRLGAEVVASDGELWPIDERYVMRVWLASVGQGDPTAGDSHDLLRWVDLDALADLEWLAADVAVAARVAEQLRPRTSSMCRDPSAATDERHRGRRDGQVRDVGSERQAGHVDDRSTHVSHVHGRLWT